MQSSSIISKCLGISKAHFLNTPYKDQTILEMYDLNGIANKASEISHYCTVNTLKAILNKECLRFSDMRFLNDSTEFMEIIRLIEKVLKYDDFAPDFKKLILDSAEMEELKEYRQAYTGVSKITHMYEKKMYRIYTCSFSTESNSINMWNHYVSSGNGVSITFNHAWNMFEGSDKTEVNIGKKLENDIIIYRGLIIYEEADKEKCIMALLNQLQEIYDEVKDDIKTYQDLILWAYKNSINNMRCFFKNDSFKCEKEYRIVLIIPEDILLSSDSNNDIVEKGVFERGNILIPFVDYKFKKDSIKRILINPYVGEEKDVFELGIKELLWQNRMEYVRIAHSGIPIRKYN